MLVAAKTVLSFGLMADLMETLQASIQQAKPEPTKLLKTRKTSKHI